MITFAYPWKAPATTVDLRDPELGDKTEINVKVRLLTMMDGTIRTRRATPATTLLMLKFTELTRRKALELRDFLVASEGAKLRYFDYLGNQWSGYILTDSNVLTTYARGLGSSEPRKEANAVTLEFEGVQLA